MYPIIWARLSGVQRQAEAHAGPQPGGQPGNFPP